MSSMNDQYVLVQVRLMLICKKIRKSGMGTHYDLESSVNKILSNAIATCYAVIEQADHTIKDCHDQIEKIKNEEES